MMKRETAQRLAKELVAKMTIEEKASQLRFQAPAIPRLNIPAYNWWNEALHGVARAGTATMFPQAIGMAAMFDEDFLKQIAEVCGLELDELRTLNPQYRRDIVNGSSKPSIIRMPATATNTFIANEDSIYNYKAEDLFTRRSLVEVDNTTKSSTTKKRSSSRRSRRSRMKRVTIRKGDTLSEIAERNHTTVKRLRQLNGIRGNNIRAGKKIRVR